MSKRLGGIIGWKDNIYVQVEYMAVVSNYKYSFTSIQRVLLRPVAPVAQRYLVTL